MRKYYFIIVFLFMCVFKVNAQKIDLLNVSGSSDTIYVHAEYGSIAPGTIIYFKCSDVGFGGPSLYSPYHYSSVDPDAFYDFVFTGLILSNSYCIRAVLADTGGIVMDFRDSCLFLTTGVQDYADVNSYNLYPNPVSFGTNFYVDVSKDLICEVYNLTGQLVVKQKLVVGRNEIAQNLERGFYVLSLGNEKQLKFVIE